MKRLNIECIIKLLLFLVGYERQPCAFPWKYLDCKTSDPANPSKSYLCNSFDDDKITPLLSGPTILNSDSKSPWCAVHIYENYSYVPNSWGYVNHDCKGQVPDNSRPEYLAGPAYESLWKSRVFYVEPYLLGYCHTYTPNETFVYGKRGHFYAFLDAVKYSTTFDFKSYHIYIHSAQVFL